jgi:hypothetical protein
MLAFFMFRPRLPPRHPTLGTMMRPLRYKKRKVNSPVFNSFHTLLGSARGLQSPYPGIA